MEGNAPARPPAQQQPIRSRGWAWAGPTSLQRCLQTLGAPSGGPHPRRLGAGGQLRSAGRSQASRCRQRPAQEVGLAERRTWRRGTVTAGCSTHLHDLHHREQVALAAAKHLSGGGGPRAAAGSRWAGMARLLGGAGMRPAPPAPAELWVHTPRSQHPALTMLYGVYTAALFLAGSRGSVPQGTGLATGHCRCGTAGGGGELARSGRPERSETRSPPEGSSSSTDPCCRCAKR